MDHDACFNSSVKSQIFYNVLLASCQQNGDDDIEKKDLVVKKIQQIVNNEYESQYARYSDTVSNALSKTSSGMSEIVKIPGDKEKTFDKYIYLTTLYKVLVFRAVEEELRDEIQNSRMTSSKVNDAVLCRKFSTEINKLVDGIDLGNTLQKDLENYEKKELKAPIIKQRNPRWIGWIITGTIATGLFIGGVYFVDKNTKLFLSFKVSK